MAATAPYAPPSWGATGRNAFGLYLDVIKGGVMVESVPLLAADTRANAPTDADVDVKVDADAANQEDPAKVTDEAHGDTNSRSFVVVGRMAPACDLVLQHPSISRVHAVLQFDPHGALFLLDRGSTHGTFVNKKRLCASSTSTCTSNSSSSRTGDDFHRLHIGDIVVFGESTRMYVVCGPPELLPDEHDSANLQAYRRRLAARRDRVRAGSSKEDMVKNRAQWERVREAAGATWGFGEDAQEEEEEEEGEEELDHADDAQEGFSSHGKRKRAADHDLPEYLRGVKEHGRGSYESSVRAADVNAKDARLFQELTTKIRKMENLDTERGRILAKQDGLQGLSEGQEKALTRNEERIAMLRTAITRLEEQIHARNAQRDKSRKQQQQQKAGASRDDLSFGSSLSGGGQRQRRREYDSDEDDDFYDRTRATQNKMLLKTSVQITADSVPEVVKAAPGVVTAESIQNRIRALQGELQEVIKACEHAARVASSSVSVAPPAMNKPAESKTLDPLDSFMAATTQALHDDDSTRLDAQRRALEAELAQQEKLLRIAMPALASAASRPPAVSSWPSSSMGSSLGVTTTNVAVAATTDEPVSVATGVVAPVGREETTLVNTGNEPPPVCSTKEKVASRLEDSSVMKRSTVIPAHSTSKPPPVGHLSAKEELRPQTASKTRSKVSHVPANAQVEQPAEHKKRRLTGPTLPPPPPRTKDAKDQADRSTTLEGGERVWVPPSNQSGDGRTALNDKYGY